MALLKFLKGNASSLPSTSKEGWIYVTQDTADMYIFKTDTERIHLNANYANGLRENNTLDSGLDVGANDKPVYFVDGIPLETTGVAKSIDLTNLSTTVDSIKYKVAQNAAITTEGNYPIILAYSTATTAQNNSVNKTSTLTYDPSKQTLNAPNIIGNLNGTASRATSDANGNNIINTYATKTSVNNLATTVSENADSAKDASNLTTGRISSFDRLPTTTINRVIVSNNAGQLGASANITVSELETLNGIDTSSTIETRLDGKQDKISLTASRAVITNSSGTLTVSSGVTAAKLEYLSNVTSDIQTQLNSKQSTITLTSNRALISDGSGKVAVSAVTNTELSYLDGVTSAIQTQLNGKEPTISLTANRALVSNGSGKVAVSAVTSTELGYLDGVTSNIQTQIDNIKNAAAASATKVAVTTKNSGYIYLTGVTSSSSSTSTSLYVTSDSTDSPGPRIDTSTKALYGAVWNDYAECRETADIEPGRVVCETGKGDLVLSAERLQAGANIVSDTFGFIIGETSKAKTPIAVSGRALAYPLEDKILYAAGDAVCAGPNGTVSKMTREEIREYPDRILGTVSEIPDYETWGENNIIVDGRIWIKVR